MKYLVILTKSRFVQEQLVKSFIGNADVNYAAYGEATSAENNNGYGLIPPAYCDLGYLYCIVIYHESADVKPYRFVIA